MGKPLSAIRALISQQLRDEFDVDETQDFKDDELDIYISNCLDDISENSPYRVREELTTTADSYDLDISSIEDLLLISKIEYEVDKDPRNFRDFSLWGNILTMKLNSAPTATGDNVYLYCNKRHQLTETSSTLNFQEERILALGVVGNAAIALARTLVDKVNVGGARTPADMRSWGEGKLALYLRRLEEITTPQNWVDYPRG